MNAFYYRTESVELSGEESSESSFTTDQTTGNYTGLLKPVASDPRMIDRVIASYDQTRKDFWLQRTPSERFEVIPMLCRVKRISSRETQSENSAPPAYRRPLRGSRTSLVSSSSAPPQGPIKPRVAPVFQNERSRQLEKTVRDQEKLITHLENELRRMRSQENQVRAPIRGHSSSSRNSLMNGNAPPQDISRNNSRILSPAPTQSPPAPSPSMERGASVPALARRVRSLVRDIREDTEASLARAERKHNHLRNSSLLRG